jgi:hypothetical protein
VTKASSVTRRLSSSPPAAGTAHFAQPARRLGYQLVLDYKKEHRSIQGSHHGALLVDGSLACPAMPTALAPATTGLDDKTVRAIDRDARLAERIAAREAFFFKLKQSPDTRGAIRLQCPAAGPSPSVTCPRFNQVHRTAAPRPAVVDLTNPRATAAAPAAKPTVPIPPAERLRPKPNEDLPRVCQRPTITIHPGDLGKIDKYRQDRHYLHPSWPTPTAPSERTPRASTAEPRATASTSQTPGNVSLTAASRRRSSWP